MSFHKVHPNSTVTLPNEVIWMGSVPKDGRDGLANKISVRMGNRNEPSKDAEVLFVDLYSNQLMDFYGIPLWQICGVLCLLPILPIIFFLDGLVNLLILLLPNLPLLAYLKKEKE